jgi:hypothetical protein
MLCFPFDPGHIRPHSPCRDETGRLAQPIHRADHAAFGVVGYFQDLDAARVDDACQVWSLS